MNSGPFPIDEASASSCRSFSEVVPVDIAQHLANQANIRATHQSRLDVEKAAVMLIGVAFLLSWLWVEAFAGPTLVAYVLLVLLFIQFGSAISFEARGPAESCFDTAIPDTELLAILTNGLPEPLSGELITACRNLAAAQSGRLLRSQFQRLRDIDQERRLRLALSSTAAVTRQTVLQTTP